MKSDSGVAMTLGECLKAETWGLHTEVERSEFIRALLRGEMNLRPYCALLRNLYEIYTTLEAALARHAAHPVLAPLALAGLARAHHLAADLDSLHGPRWPNEIAVQGACRDYVNRLTQLGQAEPELLVAHAYVRYLGDLSGGQMLRRIVSGSLQLAEPAGTRFYDFGSPAEAVALAQRFRAGVDAIVAKPEVKAAIVEEARRSFHLHRQLFDELANACRPLSGVVVSAVS